MSGVWINVWKERYTGKRFRGCLNHESADAARESAANTIAENHSKPDLAEYCGPIPLKEWDPA